jgi:RNA polymerase sigma-70 factor (ECF subfamily)
MQAMPESELITAGRQGDCAAISELLGRHYSYCLHVARQILRSEEDAEDAVQSAMLSAFRHVAGFRGHSRFRTWLARIVVNQCLMQLRAPEHRERWTDLEGLHGRGEVSMPASPSLDAESQMLGTQIGAAMAEAALRLPEHLREVFNLYAGAGLSLREVAASLGLTLCCTKTRVFRANARMRTYLQPVWSAVGAPVAPRSNACAL